MLAATAVTACGGGAEKATKGQPSAVASTPRESFPPTTLPTATAPGDISTTTSSSALPVPQDGPTEVAHFPVPAGVKVKGPGPQAKSWQFDITTKDTASVLAFYRKALADAGYTVKNDVRETIGIEKVHYDIAFSGPADGYIVADPTENDVFVLVQSLPTAR
ncbi:MAG: hypothetical protein ACR2FG_14885 [Marmoricola sp.]